jgi:hypothetical protein
MATPPLLLNVAPAIICNGVNTLVAIRYPAKTVGLPAAIKVQPARGSPRRAKGLRLTNTVALPNAIGATCVRHTGDAGNKCGVLRSPNAAAGFKLTNTVGLPLAIT